MQSSRLFGLLLSLVLVAGCGSNGNPPVTNPDGGGGMCNPKTCGGMCCGPKCVDIMGADAKNCGACGKVCGMSEKCVGGVCQCGTQGTCASNFSCCPNTGCKNTQNDALNCGGCARTCKSNETCEAGACRVVPACASCTGTCCNNTCVDTTSDTSNCGGCNIVCNSNETCENAACVTNQTGDGGGGNCQCTSQCLLGCLAGCCAEEILLGTCSPDSELPRRLAGLIDRPPLPPRRP